MVCHCPSQQRDNRHHPAGRTKGLTGRCPRRFASGSPKAERTPPQLGGHCTKTKHSAEHPERQGAGHRPRHAPANRHTRARTASATLQTRKHQQPRPNPWILAINRNTENAYRKGESLTNETHSAGHQETHDQSESAGRKMIHAYWETAKKTGFELLISDDGILGHMT